MMRAMVRWMTAGALGWALLLPSTLEAQGRANGRARAVPPPVRSGAPAPAARGAAARAVPTRTPAAVRTQAGRVEQGRDDRGRGRDDDRRDDRGRDDRWDRDRDDDDDRYSRDRWDDARWERGRGDVGRWQVRSDADLRLFGFLGVDIRWDSRDRFDRRRWVERYHRYDGRVGFWRPIDGWFAPRWGAIRFERDPLRYGPRPLDHRDLRRILGKRTFQHIARETPGGVGHMWGRVERFGPGGWAHTLEIWSGDRFLAALTDFDRDGWVDDVVVNGRYWR